MRSAAAPAVIANVHRDGLGSGSVSADDDTRYGAMRHFLLDSGSRSSVAHHFDCRYLTKMLWSVRIVNVLALLRDLVQPELVLRLALQYFPTACSIALAQTRDKRETVNFCNMCASLF